MSLRRLSLAAIASALALVVLLWLRRPPSPPPSPPREILLRELSVRDGRSFARDEVAPFTGWVLEFYPDQTPKSRSAMSNGLLHGASHGWHTNGQLQVSEAFAHGVSHGTRIKYYPDGAKLSEATIVQGKIEGVFRRWHANGSIAEEIAMSNNLPHGTSRSFHENGALKAQAVLSQGQVLEPSADPGAPESATARSSDPD